MGTKIMKDFELTPMNMLIIGGGLIAVIIYMKGAKNTGEAVGGAVVDMVTGIVHGIGSGVYDLTSNATTYLTGNPLKNDPVAVAKGKAIINDTWGSKSPISVFNL